MPRLRPEIAVPAALGLVLRLAHFAALAARDPLFRFPVVDAAYHASEAQRILATGWTEPGTGAFYKAPLLSYVDAVLFALFGPSNGVVALRLLNVALGTLAVVLVARLAARLGGPRAAWIAGLAAALYGTAIYFDATLLQPPMLCVALLFAGDRVVVGLDDAGRAPRALFAAGVAAGVATVTRGEGLLVAAGLAALAAVAVRRARWESPRPGRAAALVIVPALLVASPVFVRNVFLERDPVAVSWNGGINFFMGNDPAFDQGSGNWHPDLAWMRLYDAPKLLGATRGVDHQRFFTRQAWGAMARHPGAALGRLARKAGLSVTGYEISNNQRIYDAPARSPVLRTLLGRAGRFCWPFGIVFPLLVAGLVLAGRRTLVRGLPLLVVSGATAIVPVLFFNTARYRLPAILVLLPLAAAGWARVPRALRGVRIAAAVAAVLAALVAVVTVPIDPALPPSDELDLADVAERDGRADDALHWRARAVELEPANPMARIRLGDTRLARHEPRLALPQYEAVLALPGLAADWRNAATRSIARCHVETGDLDEAIRWYRRFLDANPDAPVTNGRPDFHLAGVPPLLACTIRLELAPTLARAGRLNEALAEAARVGTDCAESEALSRKAEQLIRGLATGKT